jgi:6-phosphogluconolactonase
MVHALPFRFNRLALSVLAAAGIMGTSLAPTAALADGGKQAVYTITNSVSGNAVLALHRAGNGALTPAGSYDTGGNGSGAGLGSGHSLAVSDDGRELVVVNAGSNSISAFKVKHDGLHLIGNAVASGGTRPTSVTLHDDLVYVLNADSTSIAGFKLDDRRGLAPIPGSVRALGAGTMTPSQIQFDKSGRVLIVDSRGSSTIDTFVVDHRGVAGPPRTTTSDAGGPFGFDVDHRGNVLFSAVALNGGSGATSYDVNRDGVLTPNGAPVSSGQAAACWLAAAGNFAYTTNAGSGSIGRFAIARDGSLSLVGTTALGGTSHPLDEAVSRDQDVLYVLVDGAHKIAGYRVGHDGNLTEINSVTVPAGVAGLAAR